MEIVQVRTCCKSTQSGVPRSDFRDKMLFGLGLANGMPGYFPFSFSRLQARNNAMRGGRDKGLVTLDSPLGE